LRPVDARSCAPPSERGKVDRIAERIAAHATLVGFAPLWFASQRSSTLTAAFLSAQQSHVTPRESHPHEFSMRSHTRGHARPRAALVVLPLLLALACQTPGQTAGAVAATVAVVGGATPTQSIEQTYYVGIFDPHEQLPQAVYRLTVHGQASAISSMRFASGWVPAKFVDGLGSRVGFNDQGQVKIEEGDAGAAINPSRRLMMFGPEGFREAPRDYRLAIVMGSSPQAFFDSIDSALAAVVQVQQERLESPESQRILEELYRLQREHRDLDRLAQRFADAQSEAKEGR
jgi:hypothetical protein